jgi:exodeoxyribonuclease V alpha subunit
VTLSVHVTEPVAPTPAGGTTAPSLPDPRVVISATGVLARFNVAGVLQVPDVQLAQVICRLCAITEPEVQLAAALAVRQLRQGSVCVDLSTIRDRVMAELADAEGHGDATSAVDRMDEVQALPWPEPAAWVAAVAESQSVGRAEPGHDDPRRPYWLAGSLFYLNRWWTHEREIGHALTLRQSAEPPRIDPDGLERALDTLFVRDRLEPGEVDLQRRAASVAARSWTSVVAGGPGTGKTTTIARLLAALASQSERQLTVALSAPSGKAAARLEQSVRSEAAGIALPMPDVPSGQTLHALLGARGLGNGFTRGPGNPLPHDVVVLDEASMVDTAMFSVLLSALRPTARLVIVGDPDQLSSVDAGRVLADVAVSGLTTSSTSQESAVVELQRNWRNPGDIHTLAQAIKAGDADAVLGLLHSSDESITWVEADGPEPTDVPGLVDELVAQGAAMHAAAWAGGATSALAALDGHRILLAHREGRHGVGGWTRQVQQLLRHRIEGYGLAGEWYPGRPILVTANSRDIGVFNGDAGVIVAAPVADGTAFGGSSSGRHPATMLALPTPTGARLISPSLVDGLESMHALTVHKSQGSQFDAVTVVLPPENSPLLTRELLYTAVTRAIHRVRLVGTAEAVRAAVMRNTERVSGLALEPPPRAHQPR